MRNFLLVVLLGGFVFSGQNAFSQKIQEPKPITYKNLNKSVKAAWGSFQTYFTTISLGCLIDASSQSWVQVPAGASFQGEIFYGLGTVYAVIVDTYRLGGGGCGAIYAVFTNGGALVGWYPYGVDCLECY